MSDRALLTTFEKKDLHWVGDGFLTQGLLPIQTHPQAMSPFLLAGYNAPKYFAPSVHPKGVGMHPHRGFETVTIVFQGAVSHHDTMGNEGTIGAGGVQWMTAGSGVQHAEFHAEEIRANGGTLEMVQLWVNLPEAHRMTTPRYQDVTKAEIPVRDLAGGGQLRVITGTAEGATGPIETFSPMMLLDVTLPKGASYRPEIPEGWSLSALNLSGKIRLNGTTDLGPVQTAIYEQGAGDLRIEALEEAHLLLLSGAPLNEPLVMGGPFVAGSEAALRQAFVDYQKGLF